MHIEVAATLQDCQSIGLTGKNAVVIDVLRATSVIATALHNGASAVVPAETAEEAHHLFDDFPSGNALLGGERNAVKISGFHNGNSPLEYTPETVSGKTLILSTTNGTRALKLCDSATETITAAFVNITSVVEYLSDKCNDIVIVCSGTAGKFSLDDALCAGMLISLISDRRVVETDDLGKLVLQFYGSETGNISDKLSSCAHLKYLQSKGYQKDIDFCLQADQFRVVPILKNSRLITA